MAQVCPVCVVAIGAGLGMSRWFGIDDLITSIWIGATLYALTSWTLSYMKKKNWSFQDDGIVITLLYIALTYIPLYYYGIIGITGNTLWGLDKIIVGSIIGTCALVLAHWLQLWLKKQNGGKVYFYYQKVIIPFLALVLTSLITWILIK